MYIPTPPIQFIINQYLFTIRATCFDFLVKPSSGQICFLLSVLRQVHSLFQSQFSKQCDLVLPRSIFSILSFPLGHPVAAYVFFLDLRSLPSLCLTFSLLKPTGHYMYHQFNIQQLYALPTLYLCVLYLSENKQRLVPLTS